MEEKKEGVIYIISPFEALIRDSDDNDEKFVEKMTVEMKEPWNNAQSWYKILWILSKDVIQGLV